MQIQSLRWDDLRVLLALVRQGSLQRAAQDLGVNISTVGRRLDVLEAAVGVPLFDRASNGTRPTAAGEELLPFAEAMEQSAADLSRQVEGFELAPEGVVRVTAPPGLAEHFLAARIPELVQRHPRLRIDLLTTVGYANLTRREADIALRSHRPKGGDLIASQLVKVGFAVLAAPPLCAELGQLKAPDLVRWVTWGDDLAHLEDAQWVEKTVRPEQVVLRTRSMTTQIEAVRAGLGVMLAPEPYTHLHGLQAVALSPELGCSLQRLGETSLWLVGHRALHKVPRIAAVWQWLRDCFEE